VFVRGETCRIWDWRLANGDAGDNGSPAAQDVLGVPIADDTITHYPEVRFLDSCAHNLAVPAIARSEGRRAGRYIEIHTEEAHMQSPAQPSAVAAWRGTNDRILGAAMMVAGAAMAVAGAVHPEDSAAGMVVPIWGPVHTVFYLAIFVSLIGVIRIYALALPQWGWFGLVGFVLFALGIAGFEGVMLLEAAVMPVLAASDTTRALTEMSGALMTGPLGMWFLFIAVTFSLGAILFGLMLLKVRALPRWAGPLLVAAPLFAFEPPLPLWLAKIALVVFGIGVVGLGWGVWKLAARS
jgi:hypothetical protein